MICIKSRRFNLFGIIAFKGATRYEFQWGRYWITFLQYRYWCRNNALRIVKAGIDRNYKKGDQDD